MTGRERDEEHQDQDSEPTTKAPDEAAPDVPDTGEGSESGGADQ
ncbi:MAG TPA: hypothetical protein VHG70_14620 [Nocardioidaceae bacterium]|jgi:hypothetical protein|nr:hypothetical protein [Nocardioidaceae bacterium]